MGIGGRHATTVGAAQPDSVNLVREKRRCLSMRRRSDIRFVLESSLSEGEVATMRITTPAGDLLVVGEPEQDVSGKVLRVNRVHTNGGAGSPLAANAIGLANLQVIGQAFLAEFGYDEFVLEGAVRTSGKRQGARPRPIRFTRHPESPARP